MDGRHQHTHLSMHRAEPLCCPFPPIHAPTISTSVTCDASQDPRCGSLSGMNLLHPRYGRGQPLFLAKPCSIPRDV